MLEFGIVACKFNYFIDKGKVFQVLNFLLLKIQNFAEKNFKKVFFS